jgi:N-acyl-D-amino-acid deacylase
VIARYVRERQVLTLEEAIHKMTDLSASHMGLTERGRIEVGAIADLVLLDPDTVADLATTEEPHARAAGIEKVWVNGQLAYQDGQLSSGRHGRVLRREPISGE